MRTRLSILVVLAVISALVSALPAGANTSGVMTVTADTTLTEDHDGRLVIGADNVTLDCAGYTITGPGRTAGFSGVDVFQRTGVTVKNCVLQDFNSGFQVKESDGNIFINNSIVRVRQGFTLEISDSNTLIGNSVTDADNWFGYGILDGSDANELRENTATGVKGVGFIVWASANNVLTDNIASNNFGNGFGANEIGTVGNTFTGNTAHNNTLWGIEDQTPNFGGGTGDAGTDNIYAKNLCIRNGVGGSSPVGLCNPSGSFTDDDGSVFEFDVEWMAGVDITQGCNPPINDLFCPNRTVTRGQMAAFLHRALPALPEVRSSIDFTDDDDSIFEADIEWLYSRGVTQGNTATTFNPDGPVTRGQMAAFLVRALKYTDDGGGDLFIDDDNSIFRGDIDRLGTAGVTRGCNPSEGNTKFCPDSNVTRGQMAAFLHRALGG